MLGDCRLIQYIEYDGVRYYIGDSIHVVNDVSEGSSKVHLLHYKGYIKEFQSNRMVIKTVEGGIVKLKINYIDFIEKFYIQKN